MIVRFPGWIGTGGQKFLFMVFFRRRLPHYIGLRLGLQDPRGPSTNCGTHRVSDRQGHRKDFFQGWARKGFYQNFFQGGQKWWNLFLTLQNWKNNLFLLIISKSKGGRHPCPPFRRPWWPVYDQLDQTWSKIYVLIIKLLTKFGFIQLWWW